MPTTPGHINLIVAAAINNAIGKDNQMLWHLPDDFRWFKKLTLHNPVIMGRKTMNSLIKPLINRTNLVISRSPEKITEGFVPCDSIENALQKAKTEQKPIFVIGGAEIYNQYIAIADTIYLTRVFAYPEADVFFSEPETGWNKTYSLYHPKDESHLFDFEFQVWRKG